MEDFFVNNSQLISEVKKRPELYDLNNLNYYNRTNRDEKWMELFEALVPHWHKLSAVEQQTYGMNIKKKWRSVRDSYARDIKRKASALPNQAARMRSYIYANQLKFILPSLTKRKTAGSLLGPQDLGPPSPTNDDDTSRDFFHDNDEAEDSDSAQVFNLKSSIFNEISTPVEEPTTKDDDQQFLMSLLPLYKTMKRESKLVARLKILEAVRNVMQGNSDDVTAILQENKSARAVATDDDPKDASSPRRTTTEVKSEPASPISHEVQEDPLLTPEVEECSPILPVKRQKKETASILVVSPAPSVSSTSDDIYEAIGKNVAHKLRKMAQQQKIIAEKIIGDVMYHGQMETLTVNSHLTL